MHIEPFDDGSKLMAKARPKKQEAAPVVGPVTEAQRILAMPNPYLSAISRMAIRYVLDSEDHLNDRKEFHFEDGSTLTFKVAYTAIEDGSR